MSVGTILGLLFGGFVAISFVIGGFTLAITQRDVNDGGVYFIVPLFFIALFGFLGAIIYRSQFGSRVWQTRLRLSEFAAANGMVYSPRSGEPNYPGAIFGIGSTRAVTDHVRTSTGRFLDIGNYSYVTGSGKSRQTHTWGFMALQLDRSLPNMMLDSKANNSFLGTNLPAAFSKDQVLSLEGDFDRYFTLYCPRQYERDALYVFTPDLMALLIDEAAPFDVEIVDTWMFVYSSQLLSAATKPHVFERMARIADTVGAKTLSQTDRYSDERVGDPLANIVAPQGRRLKRGIPVITVIITVVIVGFWLTRAILDVMN
jgi:hypothetical protein